MEASGWFGVRCVFTIDSKPDAIYEERVTIWRADDVEQAIEQAEAEAGEYAASVDAIYLGLAQAYAMTDDVIAGAEVFSLIRTSSLQPAEYLDTYFDTGNERQSEAMDESG